MSRTVGDDASTNKMLQAETLSFGGQSSQREQERRFQLQMERGEEMRRFLATQAANTHPRLARLMKKNQMPAASITEIRQSIQLPQIRSAERRQSESVSPAAKTSFEERLDESQRQPLMQKPQQQNNYAQGTEPFYGYPIQPMPYQMGFPQYQQYQPYQPNPYLPPISQFSGFGGSGYRDPHAQQFPPNSFPSSNYPQPPPGQPPSEMYFRHRNVNDFNLNAQPTSQPTSRRSTDRGRDLRESHQYGRRQDNHQSKEQYAAELERQIKEKEERKRKERNFRSQPESGFIGDKVVSQRNVNQNNGSREGMGNIGYDEHQNHNNRSHQQSLYLRELDEQIRIKKEMQTKERVHAEHTQFPPQTAVYIAPEFNEGRRGSRKQFPTETAKIFNSLVFPIAAQRNPSQIRSKYAPLPGIRSASNSNDNLPSMFPPPASNDTSGAIDLGASNFVRGATHVSNMVGWQKDEFMAKQDLKRKNQLEIQDALKQQIAQKEYLKRKKIADERAEDDKERARIEHEQAMLKERYQKEKEEARIKEVKTNLIVGTGFKGKASCDCRKKCKKEANARRYSNTTESEESFSST